LILQERTTIGEDPVAEGEEMTGRRQERTKIGEDPVVEGEEMTGRREVEKKETTWRREMEEGDLDRTKERSGPKSQKE
jgi:hypothetical protein